MRLIVVGSARQRKHLRAALDSPTDIAGEFSSLAAARRAGIAADAVLMPAENDWEDDDDVNFEPLTTREIQVLELLAEGLTNKAIAGRLGISDQTVKFHLAAITGKLGAANRTDAVRKAVQRGLVVL